MAASYLRICSRNEPENWIASATEADRSARVISGGRSPDDVIPVRQNQGAIDYIFQFAYITRPVIVHEKFLNARIERDFLVVAVHAACVAFEQEFDECREVLTPFAQRRHVDMKDTEAEVKVFAKPALRHHLTEITIGCGDDTHLNRAC